jgi:hypothetical protein
MNKSYTISNDATHRIVTEKHTEHPCDFETTNKEHDSITSEDKSDNRNLLNDIREALYRDQKNSLKNSAREFEIYHLKDIRNEYGSMKIGYIAATASLVCSLVGVAGSNAESLSNLFNFLPKNKLEQAKFFQPLSTFIDKFEGLYRQRIQFNQRVAQELKQYIEGKRRLRDQHKQDVLRMVSEQKSSEERTKNSIQ